MALSGYPASRCKSNYGCKIVLTNCFKVFDGSGQPIQLDESSISIAVASSSGIEPISSEEMRGIAEGWTKIVTDGITSGGFEFSCGTKMVLTSSRSIENVY